MQKRRISISLLNNEKKKIFKRKIFKTSFELFFHGDRNNTIFHNKINFDTTFLLQKFVKLHDVVTEYPAFCYTCCSSSTFAIKKFRTNRIVRNQFSSSNAFISRYSTFTNVNYAANYAVILDFKILRVQYFFQFLYPPKHFIVAKYILLPRTNYIIQTSTLFYPYNFSNCWKFKHFIDLTFSFHPMKMFSQSEYLSFEYL